MTQNYLIYKNLGKKITQYEQPKYLLEIKIAQLSSLSKRRSREVHSVGTEGRKLERFFFFRFEHVIDMRTEWICDLSNTDMDYKYAK